MRIQKGATVESIVEKLDPNLRQISEKLRTIVKKVLPEAEEKVKWGNITYLKDGKNLAWIILYNDHADFGFFRGAELKSQMLEGAGKGLRHIKITNVENVPESEISRLLLEAAKLENS